MLNILAILNTYYSLINKSTYIFLKGQSYLYFCLKHIYLLSPNRIKWTVRYTLNTFKMAVYLLWFSV